MLNGENFKIPLRIDLEPYRAVYRDDCLEGALDKEEVNPREEEIKNYLKTIDRTSHLDYPKQEKEADLAQIDNAELFNALEDLKPVQLADSASDSDLDKFDRPVLSEYDSEKETLENLSSCGSDDSDIAARNS